MDAHALYEQIDNYLINYGNKDIDNRVHCASALDGFFAAIGCAPKMITPSQWLPLIWGGDEHAPKWETIEQAQEYMSAIMAMYNLVMQSLSQGEFEALFMEREVEGKTYTIVDDWCAGFIIGVNQWGPMPPELLSAIEDDLHPILLFSTEKGFNQLDSMPDEEVEFWQDEIEPAVARIYKALRTPVKRISKTGRNDPCPCGSGKKYKKCCLH